MSGWRVLYLGSLAPGGTCGMRLRAFRDLGHCVEAVESGLASGGRAWDALRFKLGHPRDAAGAVAELRRLGRGGGFDLLWLDKVLILPPGALAEFREHNPGAVVAGYSLDNMLLRHNRSARFLRCLPLHDVYFTTKSFAVDPLRELGAPRVEFVDNAYDPHTHRPVALTDEDRSVYDADVGFVGTFERARAEALLALARDGLEVRVFGNGWGAWRDLNGRLDVTGRPAVGDAYAKALCGARVNLCFLRRMNGDRQTTRSVEIPACGAFMLAERTAEHQALFEEGREAAFFSGQLELAAKARFYLEHPEERLRIAAAGRKRCLRSGYGYPEQIERMLDVVQRIRRRRGAP